MNLLSFSFAHLSLLPILFVCLLFVCLFVYAFESLLQGSNLSPFLFNICMKLLGEVICQQEAQYQYSHDTNYTSLVHAGRDTVECLQTVRAWMERKWL